MKRKISAIKAPSRLFSLMLVLAFLVSAVPQPAMAAVNAATCGKTYTVVSGDTLSSIAAKYNTTVQVLAQLNDLEEPYVLSIGQKLCLPAGATATTTTTSSNSKKLDFNVARNGTRITVDVAGGASRANYRVSVGQDKRFPKDWTRLGKVHVDKNSKGSAIFGLPQNLRKEPFYIMCLKNMVSNAVVCRKITQ